MPSRNECNPSPRGINKGLGMNLFVSLINSYDNLVKRKKIEQESKKEEYGQI